jgi:4a-hydroxytetrahydrobiopterin dehydratase
VTVFRWAQRFTPLLADAARFARHACSRNGSRRRGPTQETFFVAAAGNQVTAATVGKMLNRGWPRRGMRFAAGLCGPAGHAVVAGCDDAAMGSPALTRQLISEATAPLGWRLLMTSLGTSIAVDSMARAADVATQIVTALGPADVARLRIDLRSDRVLVTIRSLDTWIVGSLEVDLARRVSELVHWRGLSTNARPTEARPGLRPNQVIEVGIDALDIPAIRPFWLAVLSYTPDLSVEDDGTSPIVDPYEQGPTIWFQQMDEPRPQRNRVHFDIAVPHDEAEARMAAAIAAGGSIVYDAEAPAFWVLADVEGNEICICTWEGRDALADPAGDGLGANDGTAWT